MVQTTMEGGGWEEMEENEDLLGEKGERKKD